MMGEVAEHRHTSTGELDSNDSVSICIERMLERKSEPSSEFSIFKVPDKLRLGNEKALEPQVIAIGPYHRYKEYLQSMEHQKLHSLRLLLKRTGHRVSSYVAAARTLQTEARRCYKGLDEYTADEDKFVLMLVLDGCFIVELIVRCSLALYEEHDIFLVKTNLSNILRDLLLIENQLPFFVLLEMFKLSNRSVVHPENEFVELTSKFLLFLLRYDVFFYDVRHSHHKKWKHLLDSLYDIQCPLKPQKNNDSKEIDSTQRDSTQRDSTGYGLRVIPCATELKEAGVAFKKRIKERSMFDITFRNRQLEFQTLIVDEDTECFLTNLIAYEQVAVDDHQIQSYVSGYVVLMHSLMSSTKDAELLSSLGIIDNRLGEDKLIPELFYKLRVHVNAMPFQSFYSDVIKAVNAYAHKKRARWIVKWNRWMEKFWQEYFNSPWALISFIAACILLILTFIQTLYSVKS